MVDPKYETFARLPKNIRWLENIDDNSSDGKKSLLVNVHKESDNTLEGDSETKNFYNNFTF